MKTVAAPIYFKVQKHNTNRYKERLQSTKTIIPTPITKKEKKANLEEDLLAGGTEDWLP